MWDVVVIGAGCAGLSAATALAEKGKKVLVLERRPLLGGRASSFHDRPTGETLDNGQHVFLGAYRETLKYLDRIGSLSLLSFPSSFEAPMAGPDGTKAFLRASPLPAPWNVATALLRYRALTLRERWGTFRVARASLREDPDLDRISVSEWLTRLGQSEKTRARLWNPLTLATLNIDPDRAPARLLAVVLKRGFLESKETSRVGLSCVGLSELHGEPSRAFLEARGGQIRMRTAAKRVVFRGTNVEAVELADGSRESARAFIFAVPPPALFQLLGEAPPEVLKFLAPTQKLIPSPIISLHVWFDCAPFESAFMGFWDQEFHWAFRPRAFWTDKNTRHFTMVTSAAHRTLSRPREEWVRLCELEMSRLAGRAVKAVRTVLVKENEATWLAPLGEAQARLGTATPAGNLFLAGDWTATGLPATIEGAVARGHAAADRVQQLTGEKGLNTVQAPMNFSSVPELLASLRDSVVFNTQDDIYASDWKLFREKHLDRLTHIAVFHPEEGTRWFTRWLIHTLASMAGVVPASIHEFYRLKGEGKFQKITVPAFNLRRLTYDLARALCRAALATNTRAFIFEISRSEIGYTEQSPAEYATVVVAAALREGFTGPVFLQGDHFQFSAESFRTHPKEETEALEKLAVEAMEAGFFNLDIDASTLVNNNAATLEEQQKLNCEQTAHMIRFIREHQPKGVTVAIGGEIGEVGKKKSTVDELRVFLDGTLQTLASPEMEGLSKVSVQTGTQHGGVPDAEGKPTAMEVDFKVLEELSKLAISAYKLAGAVQHGASTLADEQFDKFPQANAAEIHLSTAFQNFVFDGGHFPEPLYQEIIDYLFREFGVQRRLGETDAQFLYRIRKRAFGPFKRKLWDLDESVRGAIRKDLQKIFEKLFRRLEVNGSLEGIVDNTEAVKTVFPLPEQIQQWVSV